MKVKLFAVLAALFMVGAIAIPASAQDAVTNDVIFLRLGYIPNYTFSIEQDDPTQDDSFEFTGFAGMGEYNLNLGNFWIAFGLEFQRIEEDVTGDDEPLIAQFLIPQVTAKFVTGGGFYLGAGLAARYNLSNEIDGSTVEFDKEVDLWFNGVVGYFMPITEGVYFDIQGRLGFNLTNNQWESGKSDSGKIEFKTESAYDIAIYVGIGFRGLASGL